MQNGDTITVVTPVGEIVGKLNSMSDSVIVLDHPRLVIQGPESKEFGYSRGLAISASPDPDRVEIRLWIMVLETDERFTEAHNNLLTE